jgi:hypothetical protein
VLSPSQQVSLIATAASSCLSAKKVVLATSKYTRSYGCFFGATLSTMAVNIDVAASKTVNASDAIVWRAISTDIATACYPAIAVISACTSIAAISACSAIAEIAAVAARFHTFRLQHPRSAPFLVVFPLIALSSDLLSMPS